MKLKIGPAGLLTITCSGMNKRELLKDFSQAKAFVEEGLDVTQLKPKKKPKRRKRTALKPKTPVVPSLAPTEPE